MTRLLDLERWPRREAFEHFRRFDNPYFNVCTTLDVGPLADALADPLVARGARPGAGVTLACYWLALRLANAIEPFRYRLRDGAVWVHEVVHASTTVLRDDESLAFAHLPWRPGWSAFAADVVPRIAAVRSGQVAFDAAPDESDVLHFTTLPWISFTSFSHARNWGREDAVPKFAFGRRQRDGGTLRMALGIEVHHAMMDGLHVGRFVQGFEAALARPQDWIGS